MRPTFFLAFSKALVQLSPQARFLESPGPHQEYPGNCPIPPMPTTVPALLDKISGFLWWHLMRHLKKPWMMG